MNYIIHYDVAAAIIVFTVMLHFFTKKIIRTRMTGLFSALILAAFLAACFDIVDCYTTTYTEIYPRWFSCVVKELYLIVFNSTAAIYYAFIVYTTKAQSEINVLNKLLMILPITLDIIMIIISPLIAPYGAFYFEKNGIYHFGSFMKILYVIALYYVVLSMVQSVKYRRKLTRNQKFSVYFFTLSSIGALLIQLASPYLLVATFAVAISVLLIYLSLENPVSYQNSMLGTYNRTAFVQMVNARIESETSFNIVGIQLEGMKYINDAVGVENGNLLLKQVAEYFMNISEKETVFHISGVRFAILLEDKNIDIEKFAKKITSRFQQPFRCGNIELLLSAIICYIEYPENVKSVEDIIDTIEYSLKDAKTEEGSTVIFASEEILKKKRRENTILQLIKKAVNNNGFEVYYQPIYSVEKKRYTSAEALIRLIDQELGFVSPEEFIPLAEKNGLMLQIGEFVFESVCKFIKEGKLEERGIEYVEVNLSVVQCMQSRLYKKLLDIMDQYQVPHKMLNLEITETAAASSNEVILENMEKLIEKDVEFSMDDYGTGFSNTSHIIEYPFSLIKFDKSMVWAAMESDKAMCALKHNVAMIKEMNLHIVAEGVETAEQAELLARMGVDYFQGYYYSKPVPVMEFLKEIENM